MCPTASRVGTGHSGSSCSHWCCGAGMGHHPLAELPGQKPGEKTGSEGAGREGLQRGSKCYFFQTGSYLAPEELPHSNKNTPEPLAEGEPGAAEGLPTKLHDDDLEHRRERVTPPAAQHSHRTMTSPRATRLFIPPWDHKRSRTSHLGQELPRTPEVRWLPGSGISPHTLHPSIQVLHHREAAGDEQGHRTELWAVPAVDTGPTCSTVPSQPHQLVPAASPELQTSPAPPCRRWGCGKWTRRRSSPRGSCAH